MPVFLRLIWPAEILVPVVPPTFHVLLVVRKLFVLSQRIVGLLLDPPNSSPAPLVADNVLAFLANLSVASSISKLVVFTVVVVPFTVRLPVTVKLLPIVTSLGNPMVTAAVSDPEPVTAISFEVPAIVAT